ncbi:MAG: SDR family oxidoreductase [Thermoproteales archaeon]|nr:SDR family oxidoreductase [Thermoproteales archaeon]
MRQLNILVNNAGFGFGKPIIEHSGKEIEEVLVNMIRPIQLITRLHKYMSPGGGIVNVITAGVHVLMAKIPIYDIAKAGLHYAI